MTAIVPVQSRPGGIILMDNRSLLAEAPRGNGVANLFVSAEGVAFSVNENADPTVRSDHIAAIPHLHSSPGSSQSLLFKKSITLPYRDGRFCFGTWQGIYLIDLRSRTSAEAVDVLMSFCPSSQRSEFTVEAKARDATPLASHIEGVGCAVVLEKHTSASLCVGDTNLEPVMRDVVPEKWNQEFFEHTYEGPDDMPGHMKCSLLGCSATVPLLDGAPLVPVQLNEHRDAGGWGGGHSRKVVVDIVPSGESSELAVDGRSELSARVAGKGALLNLVVRDGVGGFLVGSGEAVEAYTPPSEAILTRSVDWPTAATTSLWWVGSPATIVVTPLG